MSYVEKFGLVQERNEKAAHSCLLNFRNRQQFGL